MRAKKALVTIVGITQGAIGIAAIVLAFFLYFDLLGFRAILNVPLELLHLNLLILSVFGLFSVVSGFFLFHEG